MQFLAPAAGRLLRQLVQRFQNQQCLVATHFLSRSVTAYDLAVPPWLSLSSFCYLRLNFASVGYLCDLAARAAWRRPFDQIAQVSARRCNKSRFILSNLRLIEMGHASERALWVARLGSTGWGTLARVQRINDRELVFLIATVVTCGQRDTGRTRR